MPAGLLEAIGGMRTLYAFSLDERGLFARRHASLLRATADAPNTAIIRRRPRFSCTLGQSQTRWRFPSQERTTREHEALRGQSAALGHR